MSVEYIEPRKSWPRAATPCELVPAWAGEFVTFADWVNFATKRLTGTTCPRWGVEIPSICIDSLGRRCTTGGHFMRARDDDSFPVRFFWDMRPGEGETDSFSEDLGFDPYGEREQLAMGWTLQLVGKMLGAKDWAQGDGSETVEGDCAHEVQNIMTAAGLVTADGDMLTADLFRASRDELIEQCAVAAEAQDRVGREWVRDSLWFNILKRAGDNVRALKAVQA